MVWTSDYPEGRPGKGSKQGEGKKSDNGKSANSSSKTSGTAVAPGPSRSSGSKPSINPISGGPSKQQSVKKKPPGKPGIFLLLGGVFLPIAAIAFELSTHMCAKNFFDPLPTPAHVLLFALIPVSNLLVWVASRRNLTDLLGILTLSTGMSMGVAILYSLMFLPIVPLSVVAILWCGFGLLALSPLLAVPAVWKASKYAIHLSENQKTYFDGHQLEHIGHMIILCTVVAVELPSTMTRMHIGDAAHSKTPAAAIEWLRQWGNQEVMLRACYERSGRATDILSSLYEVKNPTSVDEARAVFYKVTGKPFNSVPLPSALRATRQNQGLLSDGESEEPNVEDEFDRDPDIAGEAVSGVARGLSMRESRLSGHIDGNNCIANLMWNVSFGNTSKYDREVRSKILLPPGAVVTNAFLIVNGTEREAAVMGRSLARKRYKAAVADKKDPLLVSTCGADRVLLQLYPVSPESKIGVRLNIVAPLAATEMEKAELALPTFEERNFQVDIDTTVDLKSQEPLVSTAKDLKVENSGSTKTARGSISTPELARFGAVVIAERNPSIVDVEGVQDAFLIGEHISKINYPRPSALYIVLDGSNGMSPHIDAVSKELKNLPQDIPVRLAYVRDGLLEEQRMKAGDVSARDAALASIARIPCAGGQDNLSDLRTALSYVERKDGAAVLWIHSAQPLAGKLRKDDDLSIRKSQKPLLYDFAVAAGPNEILSGLYNCPGLVRVNRGSGVAEDLHRLLSMWQNGKTDTPVGGISYWSKPLSDAVAKADSVKAADPALAKLVAFDEISKIQTVHGNHRCKYARKAVALSNAYHLVTSFSSAIITEPIPQRLALQEKIKPSEFQLHDPRILGSMKVRPSQMLGLDRISSAAKSLSPGSQTRSTQSVETIMGTLQGATSGTVAASPPALNLNAPQASSADFAVLGKERRELSKAKFDVSDKKQNSLKDEAGNSEFDDDEAGSDGAADEIGTFEPADKSALETSPVVPESDTYILFGVGMLILGYALQTRKNVRVKKA